MLSEKDLPVRCISTHYHQKAKQSRIDFSVCNFKDNRKTTTKTSHVLDHGSLPTLYQQYYSHFTDAESEHQRS